MAPFVAERRHSGKPALRVLFVYAMVINARRQRRRSADALLYSAPTCQSTSVSTVDCHHLRLSDCSRRYMLGRIHGAAVASVVLSQHYDAML